jgi:hypothetical protein
MVAADGDPQVFLPNARNRLEKVRVPKEKIAWRFS